VTLEEWERRVREARQAWSDGRKADALATLDETAKRIESEPPRDAAQWEREQTLALKASLLLDDQACAQDAATAYLEIAALQRGTLRSYGRSVGFALAQAALAMFQSGKASDAFTVAEDAVALLGLHGDSSEAFQQVIERIRQFHEERAKRKEPSPSKRW